MARPEVTGRKLADVDPDCLTIAEFCERHRISIQMFYKHRALMPVSFNIGSRVLITKESAARWRREREQAP